MYTGVTYITFFSDPEYSKCGIYEELVDGTLKPLHTPHATKLVTQRKPKHAQKSVDETLAVQMEQTAVDKRYKPLRRPEISVSLLTFQKQKPDLSSMSLQKLEVDASPKSPRKQNVCRGNSLRKIPEIQEGHKSLQEQNAKESSKLLQDKLGATTSHKRQRAPRKPVKLVPLRKLHYQQEECGSAMSSVVQVLYTVFYP